MLEFFSSVAIAMVAIYVGFALLGLIGFGAADGMTLYVGLFVLLAGAGLLSAAEAPRRQLP